MSPDNLLEKVKRLREITGVGFKDCKIAIDETYGDVEKSIELLSKWTRKLKVFSLEEAVYNLTGKQADICRIPKRGRLVPGYFADMILFDPNKITTSAAYRKDDLPAKSDRLIVDPIGIKEIWVNGVNKNKSTAGKLIREYLS